MFATKIGCDKDDVCLLDGKKVQQEFLDFAALSTTE
jgi:hypothetical protein